VRVDVDEASRELLFEKRARPPAKEPAEGAATSTAISPPSKTR
jgi:hypothetical protein